MLGRILVFLGGLLVVALSVDPSTAGGIVAAVVSGWVLHAQCI